MKSVRTNVILIASMLLTASTLWLDAAVTTADFSRYEVILNRMPFGEPRQEPGPPPSGNPAAESWIKKIKMVAVTEANGETKVGFVDIVSNKSYYLRVGEDEDGIKLLDADYETETAVLLKDGVEYEINMAGPVESGPGAEGAADVAGASGTGMRESPRERLRKRREISRHKKVEPPKMTEEELDQHLKSQQMDLIRNHEQGDSPPPLPMELTPEMDAQLVAEGVLPPNTGEEAPAEEQPAE